MRHLAGTIGLPLGTVHYLLKPRPPPSSSFNNSGIILVRHSSSLKPTLKDANILHRYYFVLSMINRTSLFTRGNAVYLDQMDRIHIDEKWFWICKDHEKYILVEGEDAPYRHVRHKNYMEKVMFLCAQARPRWDPTARRMWDGKIGMWPIGRYSEAVRTSVNRPAGTKTWENETMDRKRYKEMLVDCLVPAIME